MFRSEKTHFLTGLLLLGSFLCLRGMVSAESAGIQSNAQPPISKSSTQNPPGKVQAEQSDPALPLQNSSAAPSDQGINPSLPSPVQNPSVAGSQPVNRDSSSAITPSMTAGYPVSSVGFWSLGFQSLGALLLVLGFILMLSYLLKRFVPGKFGPLSHKKHLRILETVALGDKRSVLLVQAGSQVLLLGNTSSQITVLDKYDAVSLLSPVKEEEPIQSSRVCQVRPTANSSLAKGFFRFIFQPKRSPGNLTVKGPRAGAFEEILGDMMNKTVKVSRLETADHVSRLTAIRESLQAR